MLINHSARSGGGGKELTGIRGRHVQAQAELTPFTILPAFGSSPAQF